MTHFPIELNLPTPPDNYLSEAAEAVRQEYQSSITWKRLRCRHVEHVSQNERGSVFILEIGQSLDFDWTWEGAVAFRPVDVENVDASTFEDIPDIDEDTEAGVWRGDIIEVDELLGRIFVWVTNSDHPPTNGTFFVRPFEFLACLHSIYCGEANNSLKHLLPSRLTASKGNVHPKAKRIGKSCLPELRKLWEHGWGILWGPPGTGKTYTIGQQIAECVSDPNERILIVSTTNKATDEAALSCGRAMPDRERSSCIIRIGNGADFSKFEKEGLQHLLRGTEVDLLRRISRLKAELKRVETDEEKAKIHEKIKDLRQKMKDASFEIFVSKNVKAVLATSYKAIMLLTREEVRSAIHKGTAPFTTIFIDEAGLISRASVSALSLLASRRVVLSGDPKQLAPISKISRIIPRMQATWLASSALSHLTDFSRTHPAVYRLLKQYRMHPDISSAISFFQYDGKLIDAPEVCQEKSILPDSLQKQPRAIWYMLDAETSNLAAIRADRGPGNRSWIRPITNAVLRKFFADPMMRTSDGLFITPFVAQARRIRKFLEEEGLGSWSAATVHSQQGTEVDFVVFDTVNAGSCAWPHDEWKRLVNVGLSRARRFVMLLASREEMRQPFLSELVSRMKARIIKNRKFRTLSSNPTTTKELEIDNECLIGNQLKMRKQLRPILNFEQQRLCELKLDSGPRLVRGVAGSGKTVVLAHWLVKRVMEHSNRSALNIWVVYANHTLKKLLEKTIQEVWEQQVSRKKFSRSIIKLRHIRDLLNDLRRQFKLGNMRNDDYNYDEVSASCLANDLKFRSERPSAIYIDEGQDMGANTLKLLWEQLPLNDKKNPNSRSFYVFYDNAQNIYARSTPKWTDLDIDMRGRSTVMKESFRSTRPITELALNVLYHFQSPEKDADHNELVKWGLVEQVKRNTHHWWQVHFNQVDGPAPSLELHGDEEQEFQAIGTQLAGWIRDDKVQPSDICIICNSVDAVWSQIWKYVYPKLKSVKAKVVNQDGNNPPNDDQTVRVITAHSFKGFDAEIVVIPAVEHFVTTNGRVLANTLYVAMTRARSILSLHGLKQPNESGPKSELLTALRNCLELLTVRAEVDMKPPPRGDTGGVLDTSAKTG